MPKATQKNTDEARFTRRQENHLRLGGYGGTVLLWSEDGVIRMRRCRIGGEGPQQGSLGRDTPSMRAQAVPVAKKLLAAVQAEMTRGPRTGSTAPETAEGAGELTIGEVLQGYLSTSCPLAPRTALFTWGRRQVREHLTSLPAELRDKRAKSQAQLVKIIQSSTRLFRHPRFRADRTVWELDYEDFETYVDDLLMEGLKLDSVMTHISTLRSAIRKHKVRNRKAWEGHTDPTDGVWNELPTARAKRSGFTWQEVSDLLHAANQQEDWRLLGVLLLIVGTGRRVGAIGADRGDNYIDDLPLVGTDLTEHEDGRLSILFRAGAAKGKAYGGEDTLILLPESVTQRVLDLVRRHPNPLGPGFPIFWNSDDPKLPFAHHKLIAAFDKAWAEAYPGQERPKHRALHCVSKPVITDVANSMGVETAAEFSGKTPGTVNGYYRDKLASTRDRASKHLSASLTEHLPSEVLSPPAAAAS